MSLPIATPSVIVYSRNTIYHDHKVSGRLTGYDPENQPVLFTLADEGAPLHGTVTIKADGTFIYEPDIGYYGSDSFSFTITDAEGGTASATVSVTVATEAPTTVAGAKGHDILIGGSAANFINGAAGNDHIMGGFGSDSLYGGAGDDWLEGNGSRAVEHRADTLIGGAGNDTLDGSLGSGNDLLIGGTGNDLYLLHINWYERDGTRIVEAANAGVDELRLQGDEARYSMPANIENGVILAGSQTTTLVGNGLSNHLRIMSSESANNLQGGAGNDTLHGGSNRDVLIGGTGHDWLQAGRGADNYWVDSASDVVLELDGEGTDTVHSSISRTLDENAEHLRLIGDGDLHGTGNELNNVIEGNDGGNRLSGLEGSDTLFGGAGNDRLDGGEDTDRLEGGTGNDTYLLTAAGDRFVEAARAGTDEVRASISVRALADNVENLVLSGLLAVNGTGNGLANLITGSGIANTLSGLAGNDTLLGLGAADRLIGGAGNDRLVGGAAVDSLTGALGNDIFVFARRSEAGDVINDFRNQSGDNDRFELAAFAFGPGLVAGTAVTAAQFQILQTGTVNATAASTSQVRFIWEQDDERLWSDINGSNTGGLTLLADLQDGANLERGDLILV
ncbi:hypothetical protein FHG66_19875 [Rubellimicrobium rubrum]|uniref:Calcium-binding protein n=1 Tax=Rubellimicrobium rubrum TaxID=2585369 RepID=A0A5C4MQC9_9RHOB|nr:Ig-like domain-containing protein [Rubellimicrobium rubrum]TNC45934.1 hypothetical protein FHG66_19875 [Rubellimicrobium rubrum]